MFKNYDLSDGDVLGIIEKYDDLITRYSIINNVVSESLKTEIITTIYLKLTRNRKKNKKI